MIPEFDEEEDSRLPGLERVLFCFALEQEARFVTRPGMDILITGVGRENAERALHRLLKGQPPQLLLTCGFAGGLNPYLRTGTVLFAADDDSGLGELLLQAGACPARFHCADRVAVTVADKRRLWETTGADAVEMESGIIRAVCRAHAIPSATIRAISDAADENLPLDFNAVMTVDSRISYWRVIRLLMDSPGRIPGLIRLQRQTQLAARNLASVLHRIIPG